MVQSGKLGIENNWPSGRSARLAGRSCNVWVAPLCTLAAALSVTAADAAELYDLTIEIGMPHLQENLRYATRQERRCVDTRDLSTSFPVLEDVSLQDCRLVKASPVDNEVVYTLQCSGGHGTTGQATWQIESTRIAGTLNVRLGAKNMTFHQRISGPLVGSCN